MSSNSTIPAAFDLELTRARQVLYRFASLALSDPRAGTWQALADPASQHLARAACNLLRDVPDAAPESLGWGELPIALLDVATIAGRLPDSEQGLNDTYERTFGLLVSGACPPYETEYINSKFTFQRSHTMADVAGFYRAFGVRSPAERPERADHIALELEFMALLLDAECRAAADPDGDERRGICHDAQSRFFAEHLSWWTPAFAELLRRADPDGFYAAVGDFLGALIPAERAQYGVAPRSRFIRPSKVEPPEACESCTVELELP